MDLTANGVVIINAINVVQMGVRIQKIVEDATSASKDLQDVTTQVALNYHLNPDRSQIVYQQLGFDYANRVIIPGIQESVSIFYYNAILWVRSSLDIINPFSYFSSSNLISSFALAIFGAETLLGVTFVIFLRYDF